ncbi:MAG: peptidase, partial [Actinomycetota bacterium]|nr:peptidase [Actinomycetota bacterium]
NLSVGPPYDLAVYRNGSIDLIEHRLDEQSEYLAQLQQAWVRTLVDGIERLPPITIDGLEE